MNLTEQEMDQWAYEEGVRLHAYLDSVRLGALMDVIPPESIQTGAERFERVLHDEARWVEEGQRELASAYDEAYDACDKLDGTEQMRGPFHVAGTGFSNMSDEDLKAIQDERARQRRARLERSMREVHEDPDGCLLGPECPWCE